MEIAHVELLAGGLAARGTQIGVAYELRYELADGLLRANVVGGPSLELQLGAHDFFDLGYSPLFNSLPVRRDSLHERGAARDYVMAWVEVPSLAVRRSDQRYEPLGDGFVRFSSGTFSADIELDEEGLVLRYPGLAERTA
jgi:hypothetical protein